MGKKQTIKEKSPQKQPRKTPLDNKKKTSQNTTTANFQVLDNRREQTKLMIKKRIELFLKDRY